jgi:hypothetical protein
METVFLHKNLSIYKQHYFSGKKDSVAGANSKLS